MRNDSSLSEQQRSRAIELFAGGYGADAVATQMQVGRDAVDALYDRWRVRGGAVLVPKRTKQVFTFATKREVVERFLAGESRIALAQAFGIASPKTIQAWARIYRTEGEDGLRPKPKGRPPRVSAAPGPALSEVEQLRRENARLRAENAYLGKLRALSTNEPS